MNEIDEYIKDYSSEQKNEINRIRKIAKNIAPDSTESINYGVPTVKYKGKPLIHFAGFKNHMSIFPGPPAIVEFKQELSEFELAKGTVKYTLERPVPDELVKNIVEYNKSVIDAK